MLYPDREIATSLWPKCFSCPRRYLYTRVNGGLCPSCWLDLHKREESHAAK